MTLTGSLMLTRASVRSTSSDALSARESDSDRARWPLDIRAFTSARSTSRITEKGCSPSPLQGRGDETVKGVVAVGLRVEIHAVAYGQTNRCLVLYSYARDARRAGR